MRAAAKQRKKRGKANKHAQNANKKAHGLPCASCEGGESGVARGPP
jgi:hypothetical protein